MRLKNNLESYIMQLEEAFANVIAAHHQQMDRWYYGITLSYNNTNSLASFLELTKKQYEQLLIDLDLAYINKRTKKLTLKHAKWRRFIVNNSLSDSVYYDLTKIKNVPTGDGINHELYNGYWIGVGKNRLSKKDTNPSDLYKDSSIIRPRKRSKEVQNLIMELKKQIDASIQNINNEVATGGDELCNNKNKVS